LEGVVADEATSTPVSSARITLVGTGIETRTQSDGTFAFLDAPVGPVAIRVDAPGFPIVVQEVEVKPDAVVFAQFILPSLQAVLDEILVRGRRSGRTTALAEPKTAVDLLAGRVPGTMRRSGIVGTSVSGVMMRGVSSISLAGEPVVYLDGVRLAGSFGEMLLLLSRIPASDVKDIQVLRGPAAAFLQGSADGVIQVWTRSGPSEE
jgi:outer membrane cobalamin receptor